MYAATSSMSEMLSHSMHARLVDVAISYLAIVQIVYIPYGST